MPYFQMNNTGNRSKSLIQLMIKWFSFGKSEMQTIYSATCSFILYF